MAIHPERIIPHEQRQLQRTREIDRRLETLERTTRGKELRRQISSSEQRTGEKLDTVNQHQDAQDRRLDSLEARHQVFVQPARPTVPVGTPYLWVQTEIGPNNDMSIWIEDGK